MARKPRSKKRQALKKQKIAKRATAAASLAEAFSFGIEAIAQANAIRAKGKFEESQLQSNAAELESAAAQAKEIGNEDAADVLQQARELEGTQRAQLAASGVDISTGSAAQVLDQTIAFGIEDAKTVKTNAYRQAFGLQRQAVNVRAEQRQTRISRKFKQRISLISGGVSAISSISSGASALAKGPTAKGEK